MLHYFYQITNILRKFKEKRIDLSPPEIKAYHRQKQNLEKKLQSEILNKSQILNKLEYIEQTTTDYKQNGIRNSRMIWLCIPQN